MKRGGSVGLRAVNELSVVALALPDAGAVLVV